MSKAELEVRLAFEKAKLAILVRATKRLLIAARTSGGVAGRDEGLIEACEYTERRLRVVEAGGTALMLP